MEKGKRLVSLDWAMKRLLRSKSNFGILEGFLTELIYKKENATYKSYIDHLLKQNTNYKITNKTQLPLLIKTTYQKVADALVFNYAKDYNESFSFISLADSDAVSQIKKIHDKELIYLIGFQEIKKSEKRRSINYLFTICKFIHQLFYRYDFI